MPSGVPLQELLPRLGDVVDKYQVCGELDAGGMSVIYVVRLAGAGGFQKLLAMKVILPNLAREERFKAMFLDEARILSLIQHPNVVPVHDVAETSSGLLYMVMDLLRGRSLSRVVKKARRTEQGVRRDIVLTILADAAEGLHAAHETKLLDGTPANIVHRDVSPQNIHVGFDGGVRLVDFGIATGAGRRSHTAAGELKGKVAYVAPEQITGGRVDRRTDVWSLGVVAWEMLAQRRLFSGAGEVETLRNVMSLPVPQIALSARGLAATTAQAVMSCLERDPDRRPASARALANALRAGVRTPTGADPREELIGYVRALLPDERAEDEERVALAARAQPAPLPVATPKRPDESGPFDVITVSSVVPVPPPVPPQPTPKRRTWVLVGAAVAGLVLAFVVATVLSAQPPPAPRSGTAARAPERSAAAVSRAGTAPTPAPVATPTPTPPPAPSTPDAATPRAPEGTHEIVVEPDPRFSVVRVDGVADARRPLRLSIGPGQRIHVTAFTLDGERTDRILDGTTPERLTLRAPPPSSKTAKKRSPLLGNPYPR